MLDILRERRSIRRYTDREIETEKIELIKEAALRSPSSRGLNPWRFLFVTDRALLAELSRAKESGSSFLKGASLCVVVCAAQGESDVWVEDCSIAAIILQLTGQSLGLGPGEGPVERAASSACTSAMNAASRSAVDANHSSTASRPRCRSSPRCPQG